MALPGFQSVRTRALNDLDAPLCRQPTPRRSRFFVTGGSCNLAPFRTSSEARARDRRQRLFPAQVHGAPSACGRVGAAQRSDRTNLRMRARSAAMGRYAGAPRARLRATRLGRRDALVGAAQSSGRAFCRRRRRRTDHARHLSVELCRAPQGTLPNASRWAFIPSANAATPYPLSWVSAWAAWVTPADFCRTVTADTGTDAWGPASGGSRPHTRIEFLEARAVLNSNPDSRCPGRDSCRAHDEWFVGCFWPAYGATGSHYVTRRTAALCGAGVITGSRARRLDRPLPGT
jgi:hypothetical protein